MKNRNWSNILLIASCIPSALLTAYVLWFMLVFRPSGEEHWGDGATIFYLGSLTYPLSLALIAIATFLAIRWRRTHPGQATNGPLLFAAALALLFAPIIGLFAAAAIASAP